MNEPNEPKGEWNYAIVVLAVAVGFLAGPPTNGKFATRDTGLIFTELFIGRLVLAFCIYVLIRTLVARLRHERTRTWIAYAGLAVLSPLWIRWLVELMFTRFAT